MVQITVTVISEAFDCSVFFAFSFVMYGIFFFRSHFAFVEDCLDAYILAATVEVMGLGNVDEIPTKVKPPPLLATSTKEEQYEWLVSVAKRVMDKHIKLDNGNCTSNEL